MWRGTVEPLYKCAGKLPCGGANILMGPPVLGSRLSRYNIFKYLDKQRKNMLDHYEMNTKQSKSTLPLDLCNLHWRYNLIHVVHPHGCPGGPGALEMRWTLCK